MSFTQPLSCKWDCLPYILRCENRRDRTQKANSDCLNPPPDICILIQSLKELQNKINNVRKELPR